MEQVIATSDYLQSQINLKEQRIQQLEEHVQRVTQRDYATAARIQTMRDEMHEWTTTELENSDITTEQAEAIAEICGFELTKEIEAIVTVEYSITLNVPVGEEAEDIINNIDFDAISYDTDNISYVSATVSNIEIQQGATNNGPEHVLKLLLFNSPQIGPAPFFWLCQVTTRLKIPVIFPTCPNCPCLSILSCICQPILLDLE